MSNSLIKYLSYSSGVINTFRGTEIFVAVDEGYSRLYFLVVFILISSSRWIIACMVTIEFIDFDLTCSNHPSIPDATVLYSLMNGSTNLMVPNTFSLDGRT